VLVTTETLQDERTRGEVLREGELRVGAGGAEAGEDQRVRVCWYGVERAGKREGDVTKAELHRLVDELPEEAVDSISALVQQVVRRQLDPDQLWFWTPAWQAKEREIDERLARGERGTIQPSNEALLAALDTRVKQLDDDAA
jgi:hypothetical protein